MMRQRQDRAGPLNRGYIFTVFWYSLKFSADAVLLGSVPFIIPRITFATMTIQAMKARDSGSLTVVTASIIGEEFGGQ